MGLCQGGVSTGDRAAHPFPSLVSLFDLKPVSFAHVGMRRSCQGWAVASTFRHAPPLAGHTLLRARRHAWCDRDDDQGGARFRTRINRATTLYSVGARTRTMMQSYASAAKLGSGGPILPFGIESQGNTSGLRHSNRHRRPVTSGRIGPKLLGV